MSGGRARTAVRERTAKAIEIGSPTDPAWAVIVTRADEAPRRMDAMSDYLLSLRRRSRNTQEAYARDLAAFAEFCEGGVRRVEWSEVSGAVLREYVEALFRAPRGLGLCSNVRALRDVRSASTVSRMLASLRGFYRWAQANELVTVRRREVVVGFRGPRVPAQSTADRLTPSEVGALISVVSERADDACLVAFMHGMGLRVSGALGLRFDDVHLEQRVSAAMGCEWPAGGPHVPHVHVRPRPAESLPTGVASKSAAHVVPIPRSVADVYRLYLSDRLEVLGERDTCPFVFVSLRGRYAGRPLTRNAVSKRFARLAATDPLGTGRRVHPHLLRHTFASEMRESFPAGDESGCRLLLQALLGHRSPISQDRYIHPQATAMRQAVDGLDDYRAMLR